MIKDIRPHIAQFIRFCFVGGGGLLVNLFISHVLVSMFGLWYFYAFLIGTLGAWTFIFCINAVVTFPDSGRTGYAGKYILFLVGYLAIFGINASLVYFFTSILGVQYLVSISGAAIITAVLTFLFSNYAIY